MTEMHNDIMFPTL